MFTADINNFEHNWPRKSVFWHGELFENFQAAGQMFSAIHSLTQSVDDDLKNTTKIASLYLSVAGLSQF
jgi:hypothetical protein